MSVQVKLTIQCDGCRSKYDAGEVYAAPGECNVGAVRRQAVEAGWRRREMRAHGDPRDFCPQCLLVMVGINEGKDVDEYCRHTSATARGVQRDHRGPRARSVFGAVDDGHGEAK